MEFQRYPQLMIKWSDKAKGRDHTILYLLLLYMILCEE